MEWEESVFIPGHKRYKPPKDLQPGKPWDGNLESDEWTVDVMDFEYHPESSRKSGSGHQQWDTRTNPNVVKQAEKNSSGKGGMGCLVVAGIFFLMMILSTFIGILS